MSKAVAVTGCAMNRTTKDFPSAPRYRRHRLFKLTCRNRHGCETADEQWSCKAEEKMFYLVHREEAVPQRSQRRIRGRENAGQANEKQGRPPNRNRPANSSGSREAAHVEPARQADGNNRHWRNRISKRVEKEEVSDHRLMSPCIVSLSKDTGESRDVPTAPPRANDRSVDIARYLPCIHIGNRFS